jgi:hypothetical protein
MERAIRGEYSGDKAYTWPERRGEMGNGHLGCRVYSFLSATKREEIRLFRDEERGWIARKASFLQKQDRQICNNAIGKQKYFKAKLTNVNGDRKARYSRYTFANEIIRMVKMIGL